MANSVQAQIQLELARYVVGQISLTEFEDCFAPVLWRVEEYNDAALESLVYEIQLRLSEYSELHRTEEEIKTLLYPLFMIISVPTESPNQTTYSSAGSIQSFAFST